MSHQLILSCATINTSNAVLNKKKTMLLIILLVFIGLTQATEPKSGRLLSNPFGILGHESCDSNIEGRNVTGICYNEVECLLK